MDKSSIVRKSLITGFIYTLVTCIVQVPVSNLISSVFNLKSDSSISSEQLPFLLLTIFIVGLSIAVFYYFFGHLFKSNKKINTGLKFASFVYFANYIPQVFFLDANKGLNGLLNVGLAVFQVEFYDLLILFVTVLIMVQYMPLKNPDSDIKKQKFSYKDIVVGIIFATVLIILSEVVLPVFGFKNMADGLNVASENKLFFYVVMSIGFILTGFLVSYYSRLENNKLFCIIFGILIWGVFDLTMIPLGFGLAATFLFIIISIIAFLIIGFIIKKSCILK